MDSSGPKGTDASGNPILQDIGVFLRDVFRKRFRGIDVKYIGERAGGGGREVVCSARCRLGSLKCLLELWRFGART